MSAVEARSAPAAGVGSTKVVSKPQTSAQGCIRRPGSTWTTCVCPPCVRRKRRDQKLYQAGLLPLPGRDAAHLQVQTWMDRGWQPSAIASATGLSVHAAQQLTYRMRHGVAFLAGPTVLRVLNAQRPTSGRIDACGPRRRLQALAWMGWTLAAVRERTGVPSMTLSYLRSGGIQIVNVRAANAIADLYEEVQNTPGGSGWARNVVAAKKGWAPPAAWDEDTIDDPAAEPEGVVGRRGEGQGRPAATDDVVLARVRELVHAGLTDAEIGRDVGRSRDAIAKLRNRYGIRRAA